jgi:hypothetical protein
MRTGLKIICRGAALAGLLFAVLVMISFAVLVLTRQTDRFGLAIHSSAVITLATSLAFLAAYVVLRVLLWLFDPYRRQK